MANKERASIKQVEEMIKKQNENNLEDNKRYLDKICEKVDHLCEKVDQNTGKITQIQKELAPSGDVFIHVFIDQRKLFINVYLLCILHQTNNCFLSIDCIKYPFS